MAPEVALIKGNRTSLGLDNLGRSKGKNHKGYQQSHFSGDSMLQSAPTGPDATGVGNGNSLFMLFDPQTAVGGRLEHGIEPRTRCFPTMEGTGK